MLNMKSLFLMIKRKGKRFPIFQYIYISISQTIMLTWAAPCRTVFLVCTTFSWDLYRYNSFIRIRFFPIDISGLLNRPLVRTWKSVPTLFVQTSEISGLSEPGLTNHHVYLCLNYNNITSYCGNFGSTRTVFLACTTFSCARYIPRTNNNITSYCGNFGSTRTVFLACTTFSCAPAGFRPPFFIESNAFSIIMSQK